MSLSGKITIDQRQILQAFESVFSLDQLPIPGPLVPFFKALSMCNTPFPEYGPVSPFIPPFTGATTGRNQLLSDDIMCLLPNMPAMFRGYHNMRRPNAAGNGALPYDHDLGDHMTAANAPVPRGFAAANDQASNANITPGTMHPLTWSAVDCTKFQRSPTRVVIPFVPANAAANWKQFLGFNTDVAWFSTILDLMQLYCKHWKGTSTLASMSPINGDSCLTIVTLTDVFADRDAHRGNNALATPFNGEASCQFVPDNDLSSRLSMVTHTNIILPPNYGPNDNIGAVGTTRFGPYWNVAPIRSLSTNYNPSILVGSVLANHLHLDRPSSDPNA